MSQNYPEKNEGHNGESRRAAYFPIYYFRAENKFPALPARDYSERTGAKLGHYLPPLGWLAGKAFAASLTRPGGAGELNADNVFVDPEAIILSKQVASPRQFKHRKAVEITAVSTAGALLLSAAFTGWAGFKIDKVPPSLACQEHPKTDCDKPPTTFPAVAPTPSPTDINLSPTGIEYANLSADAGQH